MLLGDLKQRIIQEIHRASSQDEAAVTIAIITAMEWYKHYRFFFNEATATWELTVGQEEYPVETATTEGYPTDLLVPVTMYVQTGGTRWLSMQQIDIDDERWLQPTSTVTGHPSRWAWFNEKIYLTPTPTEADDVRLDYVKDLGIPTYAWSAGAWVFADEAGVTLTDNYTNDWIEHAEPLIRQRAKFDLYFNYYDDAENAQKMDLAVGAALANIRSKSSAYKRLIGRTPTRI
jgi:hypothetical protein